MKKIQLLVLALSRTLGQGLPTCLFHCRLPYVSFYRQDSAHILAVTHPPLKRR